jgi:hypothetical protein
MLDERRHESANLKDYEVLDSSDTLSGAPGDDPLDRGIATPERWSIGIRFGSTAEEQIAGPSLDQWLAQESPDDDGDPSDDRPDGISWDENATENDISGYASADGPEPRAGRLVTADDDGAVYRTWETDAVAREAGIDGGGATAEEAALHLFSAEDTGP